MVSKDVPNVPEVAPNVAAHLSAYSAIQDTSYTIKPATRTVPLGVISIARHRSVKSALTTA